MSNQARQLLSPQDAGGRVGVGREGSHPSTPQKGIHRCGSHGHSGYVEVFWRAMCSQEVVVYCDVKETSVPEWAAHLSVCEIFASRVSVCNISAHGDVYFRAYMLIFDQ